MAKIALNTTTDRIRSVIGTSKGVICHTSRTGSFSLRPEDMFVLLSAAHSPLAAEFVNYSTVARLSDGATGEEIYEDFLKVNERFVRLAPLAIEKRKETIQGLDVVVSSYPLEIEGELILDNEGNVRTYLAIDGLALSSMGIAISEEEKELL